MRPMFVEVRQLMSFAITNLIYTLGLLVGMLFLLEVGRRIGLWRMAVDTEGARAGIGTVEGALLALLGLLIAFSFSGAAARFDARRQQIIDEANDIGSAYMLVDLLPSEAQPPLRDKFSAVCRFAIGSLSQDAGPCCCASRVRALEDFAERNLDAGYRCNP